MTIERGERDGQVLHPTVIWRRESEMSTSAKGASCTFNQSSWPKQVLDYLERNDDILGIALDWPRQSFSRMSDEGRRWKTLTRKVDGTLGDVEADRVEALATQIPNKVACATTSIEDAPITAHQMLLETTDTSWHQWVAKR